MVEYSDYWAGVEWCAWDRCINCGAAEDKHERRPYTDDATALFCYCWPDRTFIPRSQAV